MARKSQIEKTKRRRESVEKHAARRAALRAVLKSDAASPAEKEEAMFALARLPQESMPVRLRNRCNVTGRARGYSRKFGLSRIALREKALAGELPGVRKASW